MSLFLHYLSLPYLLEGIELTLQVTALGLLGGLILGLVLAWMQLSRFWLLAAFARGYTVIFRGTPLILQMVFAYDALPHIGIKLPAVLAAGLALACNEAPFIAEMLRSGMNPQHYRVVHRASLEEAEPLLAAERLSIVLGALSQTYDYVVAATPALVGLLNAERLARFARATVLVAGEGWEAAASTEAAALAAKGFANVMIAAVSDTPTDRSGGRAAA